MSQELTEQEKVQAIIDDACKYANDGWWVLRKGYITRDEHLNRVDRHFSAIIETIRRRGYTVELKTAWGVTEATITPKMELV